MIKKTLITLLSLCFFINPMTVYGATDPQAEALVITCVDYRLTDDVAKVLKAEGLEGKYDMISMAGSSLAVSNDFFPAWKDTFWTHVNLLLNLHNFQKVIVIDHRNCGMYKMVYNKDLKLNPEEEKKTHSVHLLKLQKAFKEKYPSLNFEGWLMDLEGKYEKIITD